MRKDSRDFNQEEAQNPFALSIGDLMAALLLIFVLLLASTLLRLQDEFENKTQIAERYTAIKKDIYEDLMLEFKDDLKEWNAEIDPKDLTFRFVEPDILFATNKSEVKKEFKDILLSFFPRYIEVLSKPAFRENIQEIRIEGHTDDRGTYYHNMELSQDRTRSVLIYVLENTLNNSQNSSWVQSLLTANGLSYSKPIADNETEIGIKLNRRVEFKIRTNAEKQIDKMLKVSVDEED
jgi:outer membrane protein OmpA-like peptidoglycan-associated protein